MGIFDANLGAKSNEQSGVAVETRARQGAVSNFDYDFNYYEFIEQINRVVLDIIPKELTAPQQVAFVDRDDKAVVQWINRNGNTFNPDEEYQLSIEVGPKSETAKQAEAENLMNMAEKMPIVGEVAPDLIIRSQPGKAAKEIADRLAKKLGVGGNPEADALKQQMDEMQQQLEAQAQQLEQSTREVEALKADNSVKLLEEHNRHQEKERELDIREYEAETKRGAAEAGVIQKAGEVIPHPEPDGDEGTEEPGDEA
jgi:hypothetical protein